MPEQIKNTKVEELKKINLPVEKPAVDKPTFIEKTSMYLQNNKWSILRGIGFVLRFFSKKTAAYQIGEAIDEIDKITGNKK